MGYASLPSNPDRPLAYTLTKIAAAQESTGPAVLTIFVNGLGLPQSFWQPVLQLIQAEETDSTHSLLLVTYDRDGQGLSRPSEDPLPRSHDIITAVQELEELIVYVKLKHLPQRYEEHRIFLVAHSLGVPLARLYCQSYPGTVSALLCLDSNMANTDFVSLMPDPDDSGFEPDSLPSDTTIEQLQWTRDNYRKMFHPSTPNPENLDRSTLAALLSEADAPLLFGPNAYPLLLTVVGHDPETFAEESLKISTRGLTEQYMQPAWEEYNRGLLNIGDAAKGVIVATGSGHFVQRDNPECVAREFRDLLHRLNSIP